MVVDGSLLVSICLLVLAVLVVSMASEMVVDMDLRAYNTFLVPSILHGVTKRARGLFSRGAKEAYGRNVKSDKQEA